MDGGIKSLAVIHTHTFSEIYEELGFLLKKKRKKNKKNKLNCFFLFQGILYLLAFYCARDYYEWEKAVLRISLLFLSVQASPSSISLVGISEALMPLVCVEVYV